MNSLTSQILNLSTNFKTTPNDKLTTQIRNCKECLTHLKDGVNPIIVASSKSKIIIIGQAPGRIVHKTSIAWNDKNGDNPRNWLCIDKTTFYDGDQIALMPMGFCYPVQVRMETDTTT